MSRDRLLFLTCHLPYPPHSGGRRREYELLRRIADSYEVELYAVCKSEEDFDQIGGLDEVCADIQLFRPDPLTDLDELASIDRFQMHRSRALTAAVTTRLRQEPMLVHVEGSYLMRHLPHLHPGGVLLVEQNIESSLWEQRARCAEGAERRRRLEWLARTRAAEGWCWAWADRCAAVSEFDAAEISWRSGREALLVFDGCDHLESPNDGGQKATGEGPPTVAMIANFGYEPNADAARYLVDTIFPLVRREVPEARLELVGNAPSPDLVQRDGGDGVVVTGRVESVEPYRDRAAAIVSAHRVGGGVKVQVLEALSRGKALVATSVALQGLPSAAREQLAATDEPSAMAKEIVAVLTDETMRRRLERASRAAAAQLPTWDDAAEVLLDGYAQLTERPATVAA